MAMTVSEPAAPATIVRIRGNYSDTTALGRALEEASKRAHLLSPLSVGFTIPVLHEVTLVVLDIAKGETYSISGKLGLSKIALDRLAIAAGVEWDPRECRRLDNGSDPRYVEFQAVGRVPMLDGSYRTITGTKVMDLRDGSAQTLASAKDLPMKRQFIQEHAESKAKNRAIRSGLGIRTSYPAEELNKPFVVARLIFTGHSDDAEVRKIVAIEMMRQRGAASAQLYGGAPAAPAGALPAAQPIPHGYTPPPISTTLVDADDDFPAGNYDGAFEPPADSRFAHRGDADVESR